MGLEKSLDRKLSSKIDQKNQHLEILMGSIKQNIHQRRIFLKNNWSDRFGILTSIIKFFRCTGNLEISLIKNFTVNTQKISFLYSKFGGIMLK